MYNVGIVKNGKRHVRATKSFSDALESLAEYVDIDETWKFENEFYFDRSADEKYFITHLPAMKRA